MFRLYEGVSSEEMMFTDNQAKGRKLHARNIEVFTYEYDENNMVAEGTFKEDILVRSMFQGENAGLAPFTIWASN